MLQLLDVERAAQVLAVSPWTVRAYIRQGKLRAVRIGRLVRLDAAEIEHFIEAGKSCANCAEKSKELELTHD